MTENREECYVDERGTVWRPPTAWAYMAVCRARDALSTTIAERDAEIAGLREILQEFADDLEVEIRNRWGTDVRLAHRLKRDLEPIERVRALLATKEPQS